MNPRQTLFVTEYVVDHNGAQAAIRAGYAPRGAKETSYRLLRTPQIRAAVDRLDEERRERLGVSADWVTERTVAVFEKAFAGIPKTDREGRLVRVTVDGDEVVVFDWSPSGANKALELLMRQLGMAGAAERVEVDVSGLGVVYTLALDRQLEEEE